MTRLPVTTFESTDTDQRALWERIVETRGGGLNLTYEDGSLVGPFAALIARPGIGTPLAEVGTAVRFQSSLEPRLLELAISAVGARWKAEFEWWAHSRLAATAGIDEAVLAAMANGQQPSFVNEDERVVHAYASALCEIGQVDEHTYDEAVSMLGIDRVVDLTQTIGYYTHICFLLNAFAVALPPGVDPVWGTP